MLQNKNIILNLVLALVACLLMPLFSQASLAQAVPPIQVNLLGVASLSLGKLGAVGELTDQILGDAIHGLGILVVNIEDDTGADGETAGSSALPTGRLKWLNHDGYKSSGGQPFATGAFHSTEMSAVAAGSLGKLQGIWGGQLTLNFFAGYDNVATKVSAGAAWPTQLHGGNAVNRSFLFGGSGLYVNNASYAMVTLAGSEGQTDQSVDGVEVSYGVRGVAGSLVAGHVFDLTKIESADHRAAPVQLDLRLGAGYQESHGDRYVDPVNGHQFHANLDNWTASASATLFSPFPLDNGATFRPFLKGEVRQQLSYNNKLSEEWDFLTDTISRELKFTQSDTSVLGEIGFDYVLRGIRFTGAVYGEKAADREDWGLRLGINFQLN